MKIIAFYLPQFHCFPENDTWWGKGFTEWDNVRNAKPLFYGHEQPKIPLNNNYYRLDKIETIRWQSSLALRYGIYGFCWYHYWFDGKMLMQKPMEMMLMDKSIKLHFCICWANEDWTKQWAKKSKEILISQGYGNEEDWINHFKYLLPFFNDERYIRIDGCPVFVIYRPELISTISGMVTCWKKLAKRNGLKGIKFVYQQNTYDHMTDENGYIFDYGIEYQPGLAKKEVVMKPNSIIHKLANEISIKLHCKSSLFSTIHYSYDELWQIILKSKPKDKKMIAGAFVNWDNTPRYKKGASVFVGYSAEKFMQYLYMQILREKKIYKKNMIFLFAWNEWGEGGYLEPDKQEGYARLNAVKKALDMANENEKERFE